jgi:hypothetical protein
MDMIICTLTTINFTLDETANQSITTHRDILKMDIEYAEFTSLSSLSKAFPKTAGKEFPIGQMMIELHLFLAKGITSGQFLTWYSLLLFS